MNTRANLSWLNRAVALAAEPVPPPLQDSAGLDPAADRVALRDELFGPGFLLPGGEREILRLVKPMHIGTTARLLVAGSGIGGPTATIARRLGVFVCGYDRAIAPLLHLEPGSQAASRAKVASWNPALQALPRGSFHHALGLFPFGDGPPEPILAQIIDALQPSGNLVLVDYVASDAFDPRQEAEQAWLELEQRSGSPPDAQDLSRGLARLGMVLRDIEDMSRLHARLAVYSWRRLIDTLPERPSGQRGQTMLEEAGGWSVREQLIRKGALRLMRWHCVLPEAPHDVER